MELGICSRHRTQRQSQHLCTIGGRFIHQPHLPCILCALGCRLPQTIQLDVISEHRNRVGYKGLLFHNWTQQLLRLFIPSGNLAGLYLSRPPRLIQSPLTGIHITTYVVTSLCTCQYSKVNNLNTNIGCQVLLALKRERARERFNLKMYNKHTCTGWIAEKYLPNLEINPGCPSNSHKRFTIALSLSYFLNLTSMF